MKKFLTLLLTVFLLLSCCACGNKDTGNNPDTDTTVDSKEAELSALLAGDWFGWNHRGEYEEYSFNADGTGYYNSTEPITWSYKSYDESRNKYMFTIDNHGYFEVTYHEFTGIPLLMPGEISQFSYYRTNDIVSVELTVDNWRDYLEVVSVPKVNKNDFGDVTQLYVDHYVTVKEGLGRGLAESRIAVEYDPVMTVHSVTINPDGTYSIGDVLRTSSLSTQMHSLDDNSYYRDENGCNSFGFGITSTAAYPAETEIEMITDINVLRIMGTLYMEKN